MSRPTEQEVRNYFHTLSNWGRWGEDDRLGTLNLITSEKRAAAAGAVRDGDVVSLSRDMDPADPDPLGRGTVLQRYMELGEVSHMSGGAIQFDAVREYVGIVGHGSHTHLDGLAHFSWENKNYNGFDAGDTTSVGGATKLSVHQAKEGIVSRGVLLDIPAAKGVRWLDEDYAITPDDLLAAEQRQNITVGSGDVLLVHTGHFARLAALASDRPKGVDTTQPGLSAACLPFLHERDVAVLGSDGIQDVRPSGFDSPDLYMPIHAVTLVAMGLWLIDNVELTELAETCAAKQRWEFFFSMLPWRLVGVTSSATNPIAMF
ncbi:cyclase family protein [Mycobacterium sp. DL440]|uniref:cyclase family protein n=1 Tax=Mycobacterium sp. DL440 TaxID=2675523 RepID=UPI001423D562|nr:cyclase family protein [Mycobacterium sp. DL440]